jgi:hypothetical protein
MSLYRDIDAFHSRGFKESFSGGQECPPSFASPRACFILRIGAARDILISRISWPNILLRALCELRGEMSSRHFWPIKSAPSQNTKSKNRKNFNLRTHKTLHLPPAWIATKIRPNLYLRPKGRGSSSSPCASGLLLAAGTRTSRMWIMGPAYTLLRLAGTHWLL